jgi:hypothetical protein
MTDSLLSEVVDPERVPDPPRPPTVPDDSEESAVNLGRAAWMVTSLACLTAAVIVLLEGYYGYAGVTFAVAVAAAINLF